MECCLWCQQDYLNYPNFLNKILLIDGNPEWVIICRRMYGQKVNVWLVIKKSRIIDPTQ